MSEETVEAYVEKALDPETFVLEDFLDDIPVAQDTLEIYTDVGRCRKLNKLLEDRADELARRREAEKKGKKSNLSLTDDEEDTEFDTEINELVEELEKTKLIFHLQSVAPELRKAVEQSYDAKRKAHLEQFPEEDREARAEDYSQKKNADILSRAIAGVSKGSGAVDTQEWSADRLIAVEKKLYEQQGQRLIGGLWDMVYTGDVFDKALTADFS